MADHRFKVVIAGGGILGLLCYRELSKFFSNEEILLFEKNGFLGDETTGRNSGVLHSGIYYPTHSLKHIHCLQGNQLWRKFHHEHRIKMLDCGKVVIATHDQKDQFKVLLEQARKNGVPGIEDLNSQTKEKLKEFVEFGHAIFSRTTGVLNAPEIIQFLANDLESRGYLILRNQKVERIDSRSSSFYVETQYEKIESESFLNLAGLGAIALRKMLGLNDIENYFVKGRYLKYRGKGFRDHLVYPMPLPNLKGLGVHTCLDFDGSIRFGPDAEDVTSLDYQITENDVEELKKGVLEVFPKVDPDLLAADYSGIRPKIKVNGELYSDFKVEMTLPGYFEALGIESPGLTAAPSLSLMLTDMIKGYLERSNPN